MSQAGCAHAILFPTFPGRRVHVYCADCWTRLRDEEAGWVGLMPKRRESLPAKKDVKI